MPGAATEGYCLRAGGDDVVTFATTPASQTVTEANLDAGESNRTSPASDGGRPPLLVTTGAVNLDQ